MADLLKRFFSYGFAALLLAYEALSAIFGPLVAPLIRRLAALALFERLGRWIAGLPPYGVLALFAVPFAVIEPFKFVALLWLAQGRAVLGLAALGLAHLASLLVCERIFHAGRDSLLKIGWFARGYALVMRVRGAALGWIRSTAAWRLSAAIATEIRAWARRLTGA